MREGIRRPVRVGEVLLRSGPEIAERVAEARLRREWARLAGQDAARQARPLAFHGGVLTIGVASSPWLHELSLRADELRERLDRFVGPGVVRELKFQIHAVAPPPAEATAARATRALSPEDVRAIDQALTPIDDPSLGAALRRLMVKARLSQAGSAPGVPSL
jgi:hypothetical protein